MNVQRSHFRRYLSITLIVLFMSTLAARGYTTWAVEQGNLQRWKMLLNLLILSLPLLLIASLFYADRTWLSPWPHRMLRVPL